MAKRRLHQVEKGRLAVECPPEITKHLMDIEVRGVEGLRLGFLVVKY